MTDREAKGKSARSFLWAVGLRRHERTDETPSSTEPLRPFTVPNLVSLTRLLLIPVFLFVAFESKTEVSLTAFFIFAIAAVSDFFDGLLARVLGQHSRLGVLMDPFIDRLLVVSALVVTWHFELLPKWAIVLLLSREALMLIVSRYALSRKLQIEVNWIGRVSLWLIMVGAGLAMIDSSTMPSAIFVAGVFMSLIAATKYLVDGKRRLGSRAH